MQVAKNEISRVAPSLRSRDLNLIGTVIDGRYLVEHEVGAGGFGVVYRARHVQFDSVVALKVLRREEDDGDSPAGSVRAAREGRLQFQLAAQHPSFVRVFEAGQIVRPSGPPLSYLAMEWLDGLTLRSYVRTLQSRGHGLALSLALHLFDDLAQALRIAHRRRVAHRDLKPANVMLARQGERIVPKLLDFGIAKIGTTLDDAYDDTTLRSCPFTPAYAAPEQWHRAIGATGPWTDVYSLALLVVDVLAGRPWCHGVSPSELGSLALSCEQRPTPRRFGVAVNSAVEAVFVRALAIEPRRRYPHAGAFWDELCAAAEWVRPRHELVASDLGIPSTEGIARVGMFEASVETAAPETCRGDREETDVPAHGSGFTSSCRRVKHTRWRYWRVARAGAGGALLAGALMLGPNVFKAGAAAGNPAAGNPPVGKPAPADPAESHAATRARSAAAVSGLQAVQRGEHAAARPSGARPPPPRESSERRRDPPAQVSRRTTMSPPKGREAREDARTPSIESVGSFVEARVPDIGAASVTTAPPAPAASDMLLHESLLTRK